MDPPCAEAEPIPTKVEELETESPSAGRPGLPPPPPPPPPTSEDPPAKVLDLATPDEDPGPADRSPPPEALLEVLLADFFFLRPKSFFDLLPVWTTNKINPNSVRYAYRSNGTCH